MQAPHNADSLSKEYCDFSHCLWEHLVDASPNAHHDQDVSWQMGGKNTFWEYFQFEDGASLVLFRSDQGANLNLELTTETETKGLWCTTGCQIRFSAEKQNIRLLSAGRAGIARLPARKRCSITIEATAGAVFFVMSFANDLLYTLQAQSVFDQLSRHGGKIKNVLIHKYPNSPYFIALEAQEHKLSAENRRSMHNLCDDAFPPLLRKHYVHGNALQIASEVLHRIHCNGNEPASFSKESTAIVKKAEAILQQCYRSPPSLEEIARRIGTNRNKLSRSFRQVHGKTVFEFCQDYRMELAQQLLTKHLLSVAHVAELVGYEHAGNFTCAYKRHFGQLPKMARQRRIDEAQ